MRACIRNWVLNSKDPSRRTCWGCHTAALVTLKIVLKAACACREKSIFLHTVKELRTLGKVNL
jgi:hypothetical protein